MCTSVLVVCCLCNFVLNKNGFICALLCLQEERNLDALAAISSALFGSITPAYATVWAVRDCCCVCVSVCMLCVCSMHGIFVCKCVSQCLLSVHLSVYLCAFASAMEVSARVHTVCAWVSVYVCVSLLRCAGYSYEVDD